MDLRWTTEADRDAPEFDDGASAYAHYWLSMLPDSDDRRVVRRRSAVSPTERLHAGTQDLTERAFVR
jgi:hypothetical protein